MRWLLIALASLLLLAVWIVGIFFPELRWIAELVTAVVVAIVLAVVAVRWMRKRLKARAIERELTKKSEADQPEIAVLRADMENAVRALKRQGGRSRAALYRLPWFVIVGPPAVGKTTAFERSGLSFVSNAAGAPKIRGTAGTRNCDWWFAQEAILLDTAGRFATRDDDHDEWMAFLDMLHRFRPERPLDGLIVAVSLPDDIGSRSEVEREELAAKLRSRLDEVHRRLEMVLPVYLLFTKADLVAGFVEFWSDLAKPQRSQVWGASFEVDDPRLEQPGRAVENEFDILSDALHARLLERVPSERDANRRARVMQFPLELRALRAPLAQFVDALCRPGVDTEPLRIRGFYVTSAMQVGRPVERVLSEMMRGFDMQRPAVAAATGGEMHSYFLADLFRNVMLADVGLATRSAEGIERRSRRELRAALLALAVAAFVLFPALVSYLRNTQLVQEVDRTAQIARARGQASMPGTAGDPLEPMLDTLDHLDSEASGFGIPGWFAPRAARELRGPLRKAYLDRIHSLLRARVAPELEKELATISKARRLDDSIDSPEDHTGFRNAYDAVKLYATLADPEGHVDPSWTPDRLARAWQRTLPGGAALNFARLVRHATNYLDALPENPPLKWPSTRTLQDARVTLKQLGVDQLPYHWALRRASDQSPLLARDVLDAGSQEYVTCPPEQELVPRQYTASAWAKIEPVLDSREGWPAEARIERWVVADMGVPADEKGLRAQVRAQYYRDYEGRWMAVLDKCAVHRPEDFRTSQSELEALKASKGFYRSLFAQFSTNAIAESKKDLLPIPLPLSTEGCAAKFASARPDASAAAAAKAQSPVQKAFEPLLVFSGDAEGAPKPAPLDNYIAHLENLRAALEGASDAPGGPDLAPQFANTKRGVERLLDGVQEPLKSKLRALLMPPVEGTIHVTKAETTKGTSDEWNKKVYAAWDTKLRSHRPFAGSEWAAFEDFRAFFQPDGTLWSFFKSTLGSSVELTDAGYKTKPGATPLAPDLLACLSIAQEITDAFFPAGDDPGLRFSLQLDWSATDISETKFSIGEKPAALPKAQWSAPLKWNGEGVRLEWVQAGRNTQEMGRHATFTLFDLFDQFHGLNPGGRQGIYTADFPPFAVRVRSDGKRDPFARNFFSRLHCPANIEMVAP